MESHPLPTDIQLHQQSRLMEITYDDGARFLLPVEYLRVYADKNQIYDAAALQPEAQRLLDIAQKQLVRLIERNQFQQP